MTDRDNASFSAGITRRAAIRILGAGALGAISGRLDDAFASQSSRPPSQGRAIIRTILEDVAPERLTGTTLIHEHLSAGSPGLVRWKFYEDLALMANEVKACAPDGVSCIVDAGTDGLGRKIDALRMLERDVRDGEIRRGRRWKRRAGGRRSHARGQQRGQHAPSAPRPDRRGCR